MSLSFRISKDHLEIRNRTHYHGEAGEETDEQDLSIPLIELAEALKPHLFPKSDHTDILDGGFYIGGHTPQALQHSNKGETHSWSPKERHPGTTCRVCSEPWLLCQGINGGFHKTNAAVLSGTAKITSPRKTIKHTHLPPKSARNVDGCRCTCQDPTCFKPIFWSRSKKEWQTLPGHKVREIYRDEPCRCGRPVRKGFLPCH